MVGGAMERLDRISVVVGLVLMGLVFSLTINLPTRIIGTEALGSPVSVVLSPRLLMAALLSALAALGTDYVVRGHPQFDLHSDRYSITSWILPALLSLISALLAPLLAPNRTLWLVALALTGVVLGLTLAAEQALIDPDGPGYLAARLGLNFLAYGAALALFTAVYAAKTRSLLSATTVMVVGTLLAMAILPVHRPDVVRGRLYAGVIGLLIGECTWALNYWGINGLSGGALLLLIYYVMTSLAQQRLLTGRLSRVMLLEFVWVFGFGLGVLLMQTPLRW